MMTHSTARWTLDQWARHIDSGGCQSCRTSGTFRQVRNILNGSTLDCESGQFSNYSDGDCIHPNLFASNPVTTKRPGCDFCWTCNRYISWQEL